MITRRAVLWGGAGVAVAGLAAWGLTRYGLRAEIAAVLERRLNYLKLDPTGVRAFARDQTATLMNKKIPTWNRLRYHFGGAMPAAPRFYRSIDERSRIAHFEDFLVSSYLLSSDFFLQGADESRRVSYVAFFDPARPCQNPFARPVVTAPAAT